MVKKQVQADCERFAYVYGIDLSGSQRNGIAVFHEGYATAFDTWAEVLKVFQAWRDDNKSFREACMTQSKR